MTVINTNIKALFAQSALGVNNRSMTTAMQQLSTGKRINSAADDAAGMAIATRMTQQIGSLDQAVRNAGDGIALIQTTEGATNEITAMLQRMRELAIQAGNDTNSNDQRSYLDLEFQQLKQQIVQIANNTEWNGFPILNGTAGRQVGPVPMQRFVANGAFSAAPQYAVNEASIASSNTGVVSHGGTGTLGVSGTLDIVIDTPNSGSPSSATAVLTKPDGTRVSLSATVSGKTVTFTNSALTGGAGTGTFTLSTNGADWAAADTLALRIFSSPGSLPAMKASDATINGVAVPDALASSDTVSQPLNAAASAIARAAAINSIAGQTGVTAVVDATVMAGSAMPPASQAAASTGTIWINGFSTSVITTAVNNSRVSRQAVVEAVNALSAQTGVTAVDTGSDLEGVRLTAADGRNIEVDFRTASTTADFAARTGLRMGVQSASYSLEAKIETSVDIAATTAGDMTRTGLLAGHYAANRSVASTALRSPVDSGGEPVALQAGDLVINGIAIPAARAADDTVSSTVAASSRRDASAIALAAAINSQSARTGVVASANALQSAGGQTDPSSGSGVARLFINGVAIPVTLSTTDSADDRRDRVIAAVGGAVPGVTAARNLQGGVTITAQDGRNLSIWFDPADSNGGTLTAASLGLNADDATAIALASTSSTGGRTLYGTVSLSTTLPPQPLGYAETPPPGGRIDIEPGSNGLGSGSNFFALGFAEGEFGGRSSVDMSPPRIGRLSFQVGAGAGQQIDFDLQDFGKNGPITSEVTGDVGAAVTSISIATAQGANAVLAALDSVMNKVNAARAGMGAVMNRLTHVMDNLTSISTNTTASRSQIEDADYAQASTQLARSQIIQQAATAVLAQANVSQQTVLKLLQQ